MTNIKPRHDEFFRRAMEDPVIARDFLRSHLPQKVLNIIDINSLILEKESFVEENLLNSISDVLFSFKSGAGEAYVYVLLEAQSTSDYFMPYRLFKYSMNIYDRYLKNNPNAKYLPLIYPLVFYNGKKKYEAPLNFWELFENPEFAKEFWVNNYQLINVREIADKELKTRKLSGILEFFMKHIHERKLLKQWEEISHLLPELIEISGGRDYIKMILHYTVDFTEEDDKMKLGNLLHKSLREAEDEMVSIAQSWKNEGIKIGMENGITQGINQGITQGITQGKSELIQRMLKQNISVDSISQMTGLPIEEIMKLI